MVVALFVAATAIHRAMAMASNHITLGNIAMILATGMFNSQILVSADAIHDFGYGTKFGTQPGKVISILVIMLMLTITIMVVLMTVKINMALWPVYFHHLFHTLATIWYWSS